MRLTHDKIVITVSSHVYKGWTIPLNELKVSLSELEGHDGKYNCFILKLNDGTQYHISVSSREELENWTRSIDSVAHELNNSLEVSCSFSLMPY